MDFDRSLVVDPIEVPEPNRLTFDYEPHLYRLDGTWIPNVTSVLEALALNGDTSRFTQYDRDLGSATHAAAALLVQGRLDPETVDSPVWPRLDCYWDWLVASRFRIRAVELRVWSAFGYAGTLDLAGQFPAEPWLSLIDLKGSWLPPAVGLQTASYKHALEERTGLHVRRRYSLHLYGDGRPAFLHPTPDPHDFARFREALSLYRWMISRGVIRARG